MDDDSVPGDGRRVSPRGNPVGRRRRGAASSGRPSPSPATPLAELEGITNDGRLHRWRLFADRLEVDGEDRELLPTTKVAFDGRRPRTFVSVTWEEGDGPYVDDAMLLGLWAATGSLSEAGLIAWALGDDGPREVRTPVDHPGYVSLFVQGLGHPDPAKRRVTFVQQGMGCDTAAASRFASALQTVVDMLLRRP